MELPCTPNTALSVNACPEDPLIIISHNTPKNRVVFVAQKGSERMQAGFSRIHRLEKPGFLSNRKNRLVSRWQKFVDFVDVYFD